MPKFPIPLINFITSTSEAIAPIIQLLLQGSAYLDTTGIETLEEDKIEQIFNYFPKDWKLEDYENLFNFSQAQNPINRQVKSYLQQRFTKEITENTSVEIINSTINLDIFSLRDEVIKDYRSYIEGFLNIRDEKIQQFVKTALDKGYLWTEPLIQLNPAYKRTATVTQLIEQNVLHSECDRYFPNYSFYEHQEKAFKLAQQGLPYVVTTGTGSGKSLSYVVPIINDLLQNPEIRPLAKLFFSYELIFVINFIIRAC